MYRVMDMGTNEIYALKRVALDRTDPESMNGYMNEIALLKRLDGNHRIIRLIDSEVRRGGSGSKGVLMLLMECGEIGSWFSVLVSKLGLCSFARPCSTASATADRARRLRMGVVLLETGEQSSR